jgi:hypothetical protein
VRATCWSEHRARSRSHASAIATSPQP